MWKIFATNNEAGVKSASEKRKRRNRKKRARAREIKQEGGDNSETVINNNGTILKKFERPQRLFLFCCDYLLFFVVLKIISLLYPVFEDLVI